MPFIEFQNLWTDDDDAVQLGVRVSNDIQTGSLEFYVYPGALSEFGIKLEEFPKTIDDVIKLEYGSEENYYCDFCLKALVLDGVGHSAFEFCFDNRQEPPSKSSMLFYVICEPEAINEFGRKFGSWAKDMSGKFRYEWKNT